MGEGEMPEGEKLGDTEEVKKPIRVVMHYSLTEFGKEIIDAGEELLKKLKDPSVSLEAGKAYLLQVGEICKKYNLPESQVPAAASALLHPEFAHKLGLESEEIKQYFKEKKDFEIQTKLQATEEYQKIQARRSELTEELHELIGAESKLLESIIAESDKK